MQKKPKRQHPSDGYDVAKGNDDYHGGEEAKEGRAVKMQAQKRKGANKDGGKLDSSGGHNSSDY